MRTRTMVIGLCLAAVLAVGGAAYAAGRSDGGGGRRPAAPTSTMMTTAPSPHPSGRPMPGNDRQRGAVDRPTTTMSTMPMHEDDRMPGNEDDGIPMPDSGRHHDDAWHGDVMQPMPQPQMPHR